MRLLDTYALNTGSTINKPFIYTKFFPLPEKEYITIQTQTPYDSRNYEYWQEVIDIIKPIIGKQNIEIVQVGIKDEQPLNDVVNLLGKTNINQLAYIIQNSKLHCGADSFCVHLASHFNKPIVSLYSISNPNVAGPHFGNKNNHVLIKAYENIGTKKPSYSQVENPKCINTIKPENIVNAILKLLNSKEETNHNTLLIGNRYKNKFIDFVPDKVLNPDFAKNQLINMRVDLCKTVVNDQIIFENLKYRQFVIIMNGKNKIEATEIFSLAKNSIAQIVIDCTDHEPEENYIKKIIESGHNPVLIYKGDNIEYFNQIKIKFIDYNLKFIQDNQDKNTVDSFLKLCENDLNKTYLKSSKVILFDGKFFASEQHMIEDQPSNNDFINISKLNNPKLLSKEIDFCYIYQNA